MRRVAACCPRAAASGLRVGMPLAEAAALARVRLHLEPYDAAADRKALEELAEWCGRFSPIVGIEESPAPECLLLDITGLEHLFGDESAQAPQILEAFSVRGLAARIGIADTVGAAWAAARFIANCKLEIENCKLPDGSLSLWERAGVRAYDALSGTHANTPHPNPLPEGEGTIRCPPPAAHCPLPAACCFTIPPGQTSEALAPLPVEALRLPEDVLGLLHSLGIYRVGQLQRLPRAELASRFGPRLAQRLDQATGRRPEPISAHGAPPELRAGWSLEYRTARRKAIRAALEQLIGQVAGRLALGGLGAMRLVCRLDLQSGPAVELSVGLFRASASREHLAGLVGIQLDRLRIASPVVAIHVEAAVTAALEHRQQELFPDRTARRHPRHLAGLVDRLSSRLGPRSVLRARLLAEAQPELAYRYDPVVETCQKRRGPRRGSRKGDCKLRIANCKLQIGDAPPEQFAICNLQSSICNSPMRPLCLLLRPVALEATSIMPDGPPLRFHFHGRGHRVAHTWGPERIETGWWRGRTVGRDYYRVETTAGRWFWVFRRLRDGRWFLHGAFG